jgi:hypothetical protein
MKALLLALGKMSVLLSLAGCATSPMLGPPYEHAPMAPSAATRDRYPLQIPEQVGLPELDSLRLPPGYREIRIELTCDLCLPDFLIRLLQDPAGHVMGEGYVLASAFPRSDRTRLTAEDASRAAEVGQWLIDLQRSARCQGWRQGIGDHVWCRTKHSPRAGWEVFLGALDSLGIATAGAVLGYNPRPNAIAGCTDIGGEGLTVTSLAGAQFRTAHFWCLESPNNDEQQRAALAYQRIFALFNPASSAR